MKKRQWRGDRWGAKFAGVFLGLGLFLGACVPVQQPLGLESRTPEVIERTFVARDGYRLPMRHWPAHGTEKAVILALHGFNDYSNAWNLPASWWQAYGVTTYAYDQRGFGAGPSPGLWGGEERIYRDLQDATRLLKADRPDVPIFVIGESMGGAVAIAALAEDPSAPIDGVILSAPAVWGRETMNPFYRMVLWMTAHTMPWKYLTGSGLGIRPSDNIEIMRMLGRDPLFIKETRVDAVWGLVNIMDDGLASAERLSFPTLVLYGDNDQLIPRGPIERMLGRMQNSPRVARYANGWHMLLRDRQGPLVWQDVLDWMLNPDRPLSSGAETLLRPLYR